MSDYWTHPDYQQFLARIREMPEDDNVRLVCADWLEEHGEGERAEFVRVQCELFRWVDPELCPSCGKMYDFSCEMDGHAEDGGFKPTAELACENDHVWKYGRLADMQKSERHLWDANKCRWWGEREFIHYLGSEWEDAEGQYPESPKTFCSRGFLSRVSGPLAALIGGECGACGADGGSWSRSVDADGNQVRLVCPQCHGTGTTPGVLRGLLRREPMLEVVVTDREPTRDAVSDCWLWLRGRIPDAVRNLLPHGPARWVREEGLYFETAAAARAALSAAILTLCAPTPVEV